MKVLAGLFALMAGAALASYWFSRRAPDPSSCETRELLQAASPGREAQADLFEVRCGETITTHVALRAPLAPVESRSDVFVALGAVLLRVGWSGAGELAIESPPARILVAESRWRAVGIRIRHLP